MKLKFKHQKFQVEAAKAVVDVFSGQPKLNFKNLIDTGKGVYQGSLEGNDFIGWANHKLIPELKEEIILENIRSIQRKNGIEPSKKLEGLYNLTIEMETGTGKTYTYIKTMFELNRVYGWSKFIVVVPSIAIREGVYKSFQITQEHFAEEYGKKIRFFIYDSKRLTDIDNFASDNNINIMIINSQAFNATGKDARRISMKLDEFRSRRPIDIIAQTNPILIIDEPQSVEGSATKDRLKDFNPLFTLRYSATHKDKYNMIYRLDAMDAYNQKLVKKIKVKGITQHGNTASEGFLYLESVNISNKAPTATLQFDCKTKNGIKKKSKKVEIGDNIYSLSGEIREYKNGYTIKSINGRENSIEFINGIKIYVGKVVGDINEEVLRRIQIRETILSHIDRERKLFNKGVKVLSLFFIDEVSKYKQYDKLGNAYNGLYADIFEEEYNDIVNHLQIKLNEDDYIQYLNKIDVKDTHAGYFSIDKKGKMIDSKLKGKKNEKYCDDVDAYDLIMKNKELLLDRNPRKSPVRFIFSHSALKEGWDNPNVFQICTLKHSSSEVRKRQEVGRGLRLCVNQDGERQDEEILGKEFIEVNELTIIASESYESFAKGLQAEFSEAMVDRPRKVNVEFFVGKIIEDNDGNKQIIDSNLANRINDMLIKNDYVDESGTLTDKYYEDRKNGDMKISNDLIEYKGYIKEIGNYIYNPKMMIAENARTNNVELRVDEEKLDSEAFKTLWKKINKKSYYTVNFDTEELVNKSIAKLDKELDITDIFVTVESGSMKNVESKDEIEEGEGFIKEKTSIYSGINVIRSNIRYDLIGDLVKETRLTRKAVAKILCGIKKKTFEKFKDNPEEFILKAAKLINDEKATAIVQHISYDILDEQYDTTIFTEPTIRGKLDVNARETKKHLFDYLVYDSKNEKAFSEELDASSEVAVYVKLPAGFYISTPVGKYNPDWAIAFKEGNVKHIYFVAETKGSMDSMELREIEKSKIHCATEHFKAISGDSVKYHVVDNFSELLHLIQ